MNKLKLFFEKWGGVIALAVIAILLAFSVICDIYTVVVNLTIGVIGSVGDVIAIAAVIAALVSEIKSVRKYMD